MEIRKKIVLAFALMSILPILALADTWKVTETDGKGNSYQDTWKLQSAPSKVILYYLGTRDSGEHAGGTYKLTMYLQMKSSITAVRDHDSWDSATCVYNGQLTDPTHASGTYLCGCPYFDTGTWNAVVIE